MKKSFAWLVAVAMLFSFVVPAQAAVFVTETNGAQPVLDIADILAEEGVTEGANCFAVLVGKDASATGYPILAHNEDDGGRMMVRHGWVPPKDDWPDGYTLPGEMSSNGATSIPQVEETLGFYWSQGMNPGGGANSSCNIVNEAGVAIASNNALGTKGICGTVTDYGIVWNLRRSIAERATSAKHGAEVAIEMLMAWGYNQAGRCYSIVDKDEAWVVQAVNGQMYCALRVPDDHVAAVPNGYTIHFLDEYDDIYAGWDKEDYILYPADMEEVAKSKTTGSFAGHSSWYDESLQTQGLDFAFTFNNLNIYKHVINTTRTLHAYEMLTGVTPWKVDGRVVDNWNPYPSKSGNPFIPEEKGKNEYPFSVQVPKGSISVEDVWRVMSTHYEGTDDYEVPWISGTSGTHGYKVGPGSTPHHTSEDQRSRYICFSTTDECMIVQFTEDPKLTTVWTAFGRPCQLPLVPMHPIAGYGVLSDVDEFGDYGRYEVENHFATNLNSMLYKEDLGWQKFRDFQNMFDMVYDNVIADFVPLRDGYFTKLYADNEALIAGGNVDAVEAFDQGAMAEALKLMEDFESECFLKIGAYETNGIDILSGTGNASYTITFTMPAGKQPVTEPANSMYLALGGYSPASGARSTAITNVGDGKWAATFSMARGRFPIGGPYEFILGGNTTEGDAFTGLIVEDIQSSSHGKVTYTVAPEDRDGVLGRIPVDNTWYALGANITVKKNHKNAAEPGYARTNGTLQRQGYAFAGWKSDIPGDDTIYQDGEQIAVQGSITLTAVWKEANKLNVNVETDGHLVENGDFFHVNSYFDEEVESNTVVLTYTYDTSKFSYSGYTPAEGVTLVDTFTTDEGVKLTLMIPGYNAKDLGTILLCAKEDAVLKNEDNTIQVALACAVKDESEGKQVYTAQASTTFLTLGEKPEAYTLIDLSNLIDVFGADSSHPDWGQYRFCDFNNSGDIDIFDIGYMAKLIK